MLSFSTRLFAVTVVTLPATVRLPVTCRLELIATEPVIVPPVLAKKVLSVYDFKLVFDESVYDLDRLNVVASFDCNHVLANARLVFAWFNAP